MKRIMIAFSTALLLLPLLQNGEAQSVWLGGVRMHSQKDKFEEYPFSNDDVSIALGYQFHAEHAYWHLGVDYTFDPRNDAIDAIISPSLGLYLKDGVWRAGVAAKSGYLDAEDSEWMDVYWEAVLGLNFSLPMVELNIFAAHIYDKWSEIGSFKFDELEYGASLGFQF